MTILPAPIFFPVEIKVNSHGADSVQISWRGVSTSVEEESVQGYIVSSVYVLIS